MPDAIKSAKTYSDLRKNAYKSGMETNVAIKYRVSQNDVSAFARTCFLKLRDNFNQTAIIP